MLNINWMTEEDKNQKYSDKPDIKDCIQHFIVEWADDSKHFQICKTFDEAFSLWEGLNEMSGEPNCNICNLSINEVYLY